MSVKYVYLVEGQDEEHLIRLLKENNLIVNGQIYIKNLIQENISNTFLTRYKKNVIFILVYDTDIENIDIFELNIKKLSKVAKKIYHIQQVYNLEDELIRCTKVKQVKEITNSKSNSNYKADFRKLKFVSLLNLNFNIDYLWCLNPNNIFKKYQQDSHLIKIKRT